MTSSPRRSPRLQEKQNKENDKAREVELLDQDEFLDETIISGPHFIKKQQVNDKEVLQQTDVDLPTPKTPKCLSDVTNKRAKERHLRTVEETASPVFKNKDKVTRIDPHGRPTVATGMFIVSAQVVRPYVCPSTKQERDLVGHFKVC